ncbi:MAG: hypothetical protein KUG74_08115 [Rhodobacteraceae bacterium]|nr:hypothetical protein [Paracoccaceae bacterium]
MAGLQSALSSYWRGNAPFSVVLVTLLVAGIATDFLPTQESHLARYSQSAGLILITVWLTIGAIRTVNRIVLDSPGAVSIWALYSAVLMLLVLTALQVASLFLPASEVVTPDADKPPKVTHTGDDVFIKGRIDYRILTELRPFLANDPPAKVIWLQSTGGNVIAGRSIGLAIEQSGLDTKVDGHCYSACTLAFAGGRNRILPQGATMGFHGYRFDSVLRVQTVSSAEIQAKDRVFLARRGVAAGFLDRIYKIRPEDIWIPTRIELQQAGVITQ